MKARLAYGKKGLEWDIPENCHVDVIEPRWTDGIAEPKQAITAALRNPYNSPPLKTLAGKNRRIAIIFSDITRATPYPVILPPLLDELNGVPAENITFFCATGTHRPCSDKELEGILGKEICMKYRIVQNNAYEESQFLEIGRTSSGNNIRINKEVFQCDLKILTGFIEPHFFMGFSGGGKAIMPGMAYIDTIRHNHSIQLLESENARWGITEGNPLWEDVMEAAGLVPGIFLLNITLNRNQEITGVFAGMLRQAFDSGCDFARDSAMVPVDREYDLVITSNSGYPLDLNVYQSVKGMSAAAQIVRQDGIIIIAAECWDGIPAGSDYEKILTSAQSIDELADYVKTQEKNLQDTWQVFYQVLIQKKAKVYLYSDKLDDATVSRALLTPAGDPERLIADIVSGSGPETRVCILPEGPQTIPYIQKNKK